MPELVFNIWFLVDMVSGSSQYYFFRVYGMEGTDSEKLALLRTLAEHDYLPCERLAIPSKHQIVNFRTNENIQGIPFAHLDWAFEQDLEAFLQEAEAKLPPIFHFNHDSGQHYISKQTLGKSPLFVRTIIYENEKGEMRPYTTQENQQWADLEQLRLLGY